MGCDKRGRGATSGGHRGDEGIAKGNVEKTCTNIINKALAGRITTVQRAGAVLLNYVELEQAPAVTVGLSWSKQLVASSSMTMGALCYYPGFPCYSLPFL
eukprot:1161776-Pelagomonas_calceolata.AAC.10